MEDATRANLIDHIIQLEANAFYEQDEDAAREAEQLRRQLDTIDHQQTEEI